MRKCATASDGCGWRVGWGDRGRIGKSIRMLERGAELLNSLKPRVRILLNRFEDDVFDAFVDVRIIFRRRRWWRINVVLHDLKFAVAFEREMSRQHFIQRDSEFIDI